MRMKDVYKRQSTIRSKGLSIPDQTDERHWQLYDRWMTEGKAAGDPSWHDFKEASRTMNRSTLVGNIEVKEVYSSLFLCDDGPGGKFWKEPQHTSCFGAETLVPVSYTHLDVLRQRLL